MAGIQLVTAAVGVLMVWVTYSALRRRELNAREAVLWFAIWIGLVAVSLFGDRLQGVVVPLRVARLLDLVMIGTILLLTAMVLRLNRQVRRHDRRLTSLVQQLALEPDRPGGDGADHGAR